MTAPQLIARAPLRTLRPRDLSDAFANPRAVISHHLGTGALARLAAGYVMAVPDDAEPGWRPSPETAGAGIAAAIYGIDHIVMMGISAARIHGALPRAIGDVVIAAPRQHRPLVLDDGGRLHIVQRQTAALDARLETLDTGRVLVTTVEQTALDLARHPGRGDHPEEPAAALRNLLPRLDHDRLTRITAEQHGMGAALERIEALT